MTYLWELSNDTLAHICSYLLTTDIAQLYATNSSKLCAKLVRPDVVPSLDPPLPMTLNVAHLLRSHVNLQRLTLPDSEKGPFSGLFPPPIASIPVPILCILPNSLTYLHLSISLLSTPDDVEYPRNETFASLFPHLRTLIVRDFDSSRSSEQSEKTLKQLASQLPPGLETLNWGPKDCLPPLSQLSPSITELHLFHLAGFLPSTTTTHNELKLLEMLQAQLPNLRLLHVRVHSAQKDWGVPVSTKPLPNEQEALILRANAILAANAAASSNYVIPPASSNYVIPPASSNYVPMPGPPVATTAKRSTSNSTDIPNNLLGAAISAIRQSMPVMSFLPHLTTLELELFANSPEVSLLRLLPSVTDLTLRCARCVVFGATHDPNNVGGILYPPNLKSITFVSMNSCSIVLLPQALNALPSTVHTLSLRGCFIPFGKEDADIKHLAHGLLNSLPAWANLGIADAKIYNGTSWMNLIPTSIRHLKIKDAIVDLAELPPNLESLDLWDLVQIRIHGEAIFEPVRASQMTPFSNHVHSKSIISAERKSHPLNGLKWPSKLQQLHIFSHILTPQDIKTLPTSLMSLRIGSACYFTHHELIQLADHLDPLCKIHLFDTFVMVVPPVSESHETQQKQQQTPDESQNQHPNDDDDDDVIGTTFDLVKWSSNFLPRTVHKITGCKYVMAPIINSDSPYQTAVGTSRPIPRGGFEIPPSTTKIHLNGFLFPSPRSAFYVEFVRRLEREFTRLTSLQTLHFAATTHVEPLQCSLLQPLHKLTTLHLESPHLSNINFSSLPASLTVLKARACKPLSATAVEWIQPTQEPNYSFNSMRQLYTPPASRGTSFGVAMEFQLTPNAHAGPLGAIASTRAIKDLPRGLVELDMEACIPRQPAEDWPPRLTRLSFSASGPENSARLNYRNNLPKELQWTDVDIWELKKRLTQLKWSEVLGHVHLTEQGVHILQTLPELSQSPLCQYLNSNDKKESSTDPTATLDFVRHAYHAAAAFHPISIQMLDTSNFLEFCSPETDSLLMRETSHPFEVSEIPSSHTDLFSWPRNLYSPNDTAPTPSFYSVSYARSRWKQSHATSRSQRWYGSTAEQSSGPPYPDIIPSKFIKSASGEPIRNIPALLPPSENILDPITDFAPNLRTLEMSVIPLPTAYPLPPYLTKLCAVMVSTLSPKDLCSLLPSTLTHLEIDAFEPLNIASVAEMSAFPPGLRVLRYNRLQFPPSLMEYLPAKLSALQFDSNYMWSDVEICELASRLRNTSSSDSNEIDCSWSLKVANGLLSGELVENIPETLDFQTMVRDTTHRLRPNVSCRWSVISTPLSARLVAPSSPVKHISFEKEPVAFISALSTTYPAGLESLCLQLSGGILPRDFACLPRGLTRLSLTCQRKEFICTEIARSQIWSYLPPMLKVLELHVELGIPKPNNVFLPAYPTPRGNTNDIIICMVGLPQKQLETLSLPTLVLDERAFSSFGPALRQLTITETEQRAEW